MVVWKPNRLGHSVKQLVDLVGEVPNKTSRLKSLSEPSTPNTPLGQFFFHVMASLAEMERELTVGRTHTGLEVAQQLGR